MRMIAVDFGKSRVGIAYSEGQLAFPLPAISSGENALAQIIAIAQQRSADLILVGLPLSLRDAMTESTVAAVSFATALADASEIEVRLIDERLTTKIAQQKLRDSGKSSIESKALIDSQSAVEMLELALALQQAGNPVGKGLGDYHE